MTCAVAVDVVVGVAVVVVGGGGGGDSWFTSPPHRVQESQRQSGVQSVVEPEEDQGDREWACVPRCRR